MNWKFIIFVLAVLFPVLSAPVQAQSTKKMPLIGLIHPGSIAKSTGSEGFMQGMRDLGYVEGRNITIIRRDAKGQHDLLPEMAADLVRQKVDIIVACCQPAIDAAQKATSIIPIVVRVAGNYMAQGLVKSLRRPGGNLTGLSSISSDYIGKQLELFKETIPGLSRVAVLWHTRHRDHAFNLQNAQVAAKALGLQLVPINVKNTDDMALSH
jgi:putative ABC transport system substrate-binding protein